MSKIIPEGCRLLAVWDGTAWGLEVCDGDETIAFLEWPDVFGEHQTEETLASHGFEIA